MRLQKEREHDLPRLTVDYDEIAADFRVRYMTSMEAFLRLMGFPVAHLSHSVSSSIYRDSELTVFTILRSIPSRRVYRAPKERSSRRGAKSRQFSKPSKNEMTIIRRAAFRPSSICVPKMKMLASTLMRTSAHSTCKLGTYIRSLIAQKPGLEILQLIESIF